MPSKKAKIIPSKRKFYRQHIIIELLSEDSPFEWNDLSDITYAMTEGHCSGKLTEEKHEILDGPTMAKALKEQYSDPSFFNLSDKGEDLNED
jgi:hypothetical protein